MNATGCNRNAINASEELRELVGTPWVFGSVDRASGGLDCIGLMVEAYTIIGRHFGNETQWRFPLPLGYPYPDELPDGSWLTEDDIAEWSRHFRRRREPVFGCAVTFQEDHIGVILEPSRPGCSVDVLHCHRDMGTVLHPLARLANWATGYHVLRAQAAVGKEAHAS